MIPLTQRNHLEDGLGPGFKAMDSVIDIYFVRVLFNSRVGYKYQDPNKGFFFKLNSQL